ncbi:MMPL family transporter [Chitinophagaceae bacterium LB-8]|uniref:MMPL family transporter n=1 Tax=Paraflavisolibacter caeni TaxID=2982496 RepID=A0A9X3B9D6_9BACT|nr:MMPL family transporter [Paraflavisolibacter caeni]MCU7551091.1 MMPL family transporter [Paraflavisolibacter caeni]
MWKALGENVLRYRFVLLTILLAATTYMGWHASKVKLSYEFGRAIPTNNPKYIVYQEFKKKFGEDGNLLVIGIQSKDIFQQSVFNDYVQLHNNLKGVTGVEDVISLPASINLVKNYETEKLEAERIFPEGNLSQAQIDSSKAIFLSLPFYRGLLYNPETQAWLMGVRINRDLLNSPKRTKIVDDITAKANAFGQKHNLEMHLSGLPLIRTEMADRIANETKWFTFISIALSAVILLLFFRSVSAMFLSLAVVVIGVVWSFGTMDLLGYKITLLTALISPLIVVIGIPNCIYFLNKFHTSFRETGHKENAIVQMIEKMGIVTLFCNIAAAIGFAVFALTESTILKEFGIVSGINIMMLFFISLILIPAVLSMMGVPKPKHTRYLENPTLQRWLTRLERWAIHHRKLIYGVTAVVLLISITGMMRLKSVGYIVDDLPQTDKIYTDLKFFETHFKGVMPLEIVVDTKEKNGIRKGMLKTLTGMDSLTQYLASKPYIGKPLSIAEGLKFAKQAFFEGDSANFSLPSEYDLPALQPYLSMRSSEGSQNSFTKLVSSFMDSTRQRARISVSMQDVGSARLPLILDSIQSKANSYLDTSKYSIQLTGTSVTFLEGSRYIINGLRESIFWSFLLIALCMLYLFRSVRILLCSLIPNVIPLAITAGIMGWVGVPLKPSTVLVFSVALGIAIDITIRFLVNYKQDLKKYEFNPERTVINTIHSTGLSIIYTSIVLIAGFVIFCFSGFGGTKALGWLTSLTLVTATITNLVLLPALLINLNKGRDKIRRKTGDTVAS